ncbi:MAG: UDP-N-acetylmuramoyl-tripeptide--D-alanyl-D-alanine ligase [Bacteroidales bacterium]|nr:UDP-N-acetylmuramoyl-tripeptide--D-alanyl-D-alanine ligase [Bacteroidales bacterium]
MEKYIPDLYSHFLEFPEISTDSRKEVSGTLFFALSGEQFNGNEFAGQALQNGAALAIIDDESFKKDERYFLVPDVITALQQLAAHHRTQHTAHVFAITGSNGKTTTKELVAAVLQGEKRIIATRGNLNNHIGVPLTLLTIRKDTEIAVVEMGANHPREIAALCAIARPDSGLITNIGKAHLEGFGSFEGVVCTKNELYGFLRQTGGRAVVNADDKLLMELSNGLKRFTYGRRSIHVRGELVETHPFLKLKWWHGKETRLCETRLYGSYNFSNLMAAVAIGCLYGVPAKSIEQAISAFIPQNNRSQQLQTNSNKIILDAYNANPVSMYEAIRSFEDFAPDKSWLILGDMFELGKDAPEEHRKIIRQVAETKFEHVLFVGKDFYRFGEEEPFTFFRTTEQAAGYLKQNPIKNATVLLKGSRGMCLEHLVKHL